MQLETKEFKNEVFLGKKANGRVNSGNFTELISAIYILDWRNGGILFRVLLG